MKKLPALITILSIFLILHGCIKSDEQSGSDQTGETRLDNHADGNIVENDHGGQNASGDAVHGNEDASNDIASQGDTGTTVETNFPYTGFILNVEYSNKQVYEIEYDRKDEKNGTEIINERQNIHLHGQDAYNAIQGFFEQLTFDQQTGDDIVLNQIINVFQIGGNYEKIKVKVKFNDETEKEYSLTR